MRAKCFSAIESQKARSATLVSKWTTPWKFPSKSTCDPLPGSQRTRPSSALGREPTCDRRAECPESGFLPMSASLIGHGGQAGIDRRPDRSHGSRFSSQSGWLLASGAAARMHGIRVWRASLLVALGAQQTFSASSIPSSAWDDPARIGSWWGRSGHAAASDPCRNSVPSAHMRCRTTASLRATATMARRRPLVFISRMPQAFRLDHVIERMSMALAAA